MWLMIFRACTPFCAKEVDPTGMNMITWQCFEKVSIRKT